MNTLSSIDLEFTNHYRALLDVQREVKTKLDNYSFDLSTTEITDAIIERMNAFWHFNVNNNKEILERHTNTTAADFFTETCLLYFKSYFENKHGLQVYSEKSIVPGKKAIRPDISIWHGETLIAAIELKVNNGWKRETIFDHLIQREKQIKSLHPNCGFFAIAFWNFFPDDCVEWNQKYVGLKTFGTTDGILHSRTTGTVENIISNIEGLLKLQ